MASSIDEAGVKFVVLGLNSYTSDIDKANRATTDIGTKSEASAKKAGGAWTGFLKTAGAAFTGFIAAQAAMFATSQVSNFIGGSISAASNLAESLSKFNTVFGEAGAAALEWSEGTAEALGLTQQAALESLASFGVLFTGMGIGQEEAVGMSKEMVQLAVDMASFNNIPIADALEKIRAGLVGETEPLRSVGVLLNAAAVEAEAMRLGLGGVGRELTESEKAQARYSLIMADTVVQQGDAVRTAGELAGQQKRLGAEFEEVQVALGQKLIPILLEGITHFRAFSGWVAENVIPRLEELAQAFEEDVVPALQAAARWVREELVPAVQNMVENFQTDVLPVLLEVADFIQNKLIAAVTSLADWFTNHLVPAIQDISQGFQEDVLPILEEVWASIQEDLKPAFDDLVASVEENVIPALESIGEGLQIVADFVKKSAVPAMESLAAVFQRAWEIIEPIVQGQIEILGKVGEAFGELVKLVQALVSGEWSAAWESAKNIVATIFDALITYILSLATAFLEAGKTLLEAVVDGLEAIPISEAVADIIHDVVITVVSFAGDMLDAGVALMQSVLDGLLDVPVVGGIASIGIAIAAEVISWAANMYAYGYNILNSVLSGLKDAWSAILDWISNLPNPLDLLPDIGGIDLTIPVKLKFLPVIPDDWWEALDDKEEAERIALETAKRFQELVQKYFEEFKRNLPKPDLDFLPQDRIPVKDDQRPTVDDSDNPFIPTDEQRKRDRQRPGGPLIKDKTDSKDKPGLTDISDPARFLELVMQAIATIEALAGADVAPVSRKKLLALASGLRAIIVEFASAMRGIKPEAAEAAALIATFLDPILDALNQAVETIDKIAGSTGVGPGRIKAVMSALRAITLEAHSALRGIDAGALKPTAETAAVVSDLMRSLADAARAAWDLANVGNTGGGGGGGTGGGGAGGGGAPPGADWAAILAGIRGTIPSAGGRLPGAVGGVTYAVTANYSSPQTPQSIRLDLEELALLAVA